MVDVKAEEDKAEEVANKVSWFDLEVHTSILGCRLADSGFFLDSYVAGMS